MPTSNTTLISGGLPLINTIAIALAASGLKANTTYQVKTGSNTAAKVTTTSSGTTNLHIIIPSFVASSPLGSIAAAIASSNVVKNAVASANANQVVVKQTNTATVAKTNTAISLVENRGNVSTSNTSSANIFNILTGNTNTSLPNVTGREIIYANGYVKVIADDFVGPLPFNPAANAILISSNTTTTVPIQPPPPPVPSNTTSTRVVSSTSSSTNTSLGIVDQQIKYGSGAQTPLSAISLYFDYIQTFYIDPTLVGGSQTVSLSDVQLYFSRKPHPTNNQSQLEYPGVYVYICEVKNGQPDLSKVYIQSKTRLDWNSILPTLDASLATTFTFKAPLTLKTGQYYGIVVNFEDPQYSLWEATQGSKILGTQTICGTAYNNGKLYRSSNYLEVDSNPNTQDELFKAVSTSDLKFDVGVYEFDTSPVTIELSNRDYEFLQYNVNTYETFGSSPFLQNEYAYQDFGNTAANVTFYKTGTIDTTAEKTIQGQNYYQASGTNFLSELDIGDMVVITDGTTGNTDIRKVTAIHANDKISFDYPVTFTSNQARYKVTAIGRFYSHIFNPNTFVLDESNANQKVRFINDGVNYITFTAGRGYTNTDYIIFSGGGATLNATATLTTNATGNIVSINIVNTGYGFTSTPTAVVYKSDGSLGNTSATITASIGSQLKGELSFAKVLISNVSSIPVHTFIQDIQIDAKGGFVTNTSVDFAFKDATSNTYKFSDDNFKPLANESIDITNYSAELLSKSLELANQSTLGATSSEGKSSIIKFKFNTNNKYESPDLIVDLASLYVFMNDINNDATGEHLGAGNAVSRHISKKIAFDKDRFAEDIRVISSMWKPLGTDVKIYARIHNSKDHDAFDDKDWTELEIKDSTFGNKYYSSLTDPKDYVEFTYGFRHYPEISVQATGIATVNADPANSTVVGVGTSFDTELANGDLIVLYDPLFANTTYAVAVVANTPTATAFEINRPLANSSLAAATLNIGKVAKIHTAFNNIQNDNVVRYYSSSLTEFDTYDTMAIKIVPLSNNSFVVPRVDDIRVIGVSA